MIGIRSLSLRLFLLQAVILTAAFSLYAGISTHNEKKRILDSYMHQADRISDTIRRSTRSAMLKNRREETSEIIQAIAGQREIDEILIYNKRGETIYSTGVSPEFRPVDMQAEACYPCHGGSVPLEDLSISERVRFLDIPDGTRTMGLITPIMNEGDCSAAACHAHPASQRILGVVDVKMPLAETDANIRDRMLAILLMTTGAILLVVAASGVFVYFMVHVPVKKLIRGTEEIGCGNLAHRLDIHSGHEIGDLAKSFDEMAQELENARAEAQGWSVELVAKVNEKTRQLDEMQRKMLQAEKMVSLGRLAAGVAHEINNPLAGILTYAKLVMRKADQLGRDGPEREDVRGTLEKIISEAGRCGDIVNNMLLFSRARGVKFRRERLEPVLESCLELADPRFQGSGIRVVKRFRIRDDTLLCDTNQLKQVFLALFINAADAMPDGGTLEVTTSGVARERFLRVSIQDSGAGIPEELRASIFEPFFSTKTEGSHVGLGLSVAYGVVKAHGGGIYVESKPDEGTTFIIDLPVDGAARGAGGIETA